MKKIFITFAVFLSILGLNVYHVSAQESNKIIIEYKNCQDELKINSDYSKNIKSVKKVNDKISIIETNNKEKLYKDLKSNSNIKAVEEDKILKTCSDPDDIDYKDQWYVPNTNFNELWSSNIVPKSDAEVAVIDSGIDYNHEDLQGVIADGGYDFYDDSSDISDDNGHGTEVSGIIAANYNNGKGIAGLGSNFPIKILPLKTADQDGYTLLSDMIRAIDYAIEKKVSVINLSMGSNDYSEIENDEIQKAISSGIVIVAAAGNDGNSSYSYPASYDNVISVGATDINNNKTSFSNYNDKVSVCAPGKNIITTNSEGGYSICSGTSFSTPIVSAMAAIIKSARPDLNPGDIKNYIQNTSTDLGSPGKDNYFGYGKIDACNCINSVLTPQSIQINQNSLNLNINETSSLSASISPDNAIDKKIIWSSSDSSIASVDQNGTVKAIKNGAAIITAKTELGNLSSSITVNVNDPNVFSVRYQAHVQNIGWQNNVYNGNTAGTTGQGLRIEALKINLNGGPSGARIKYQVHVQNIGWQDWVYDGDTAGTTGQGLRIEALRIVLENAPGYSIAYQAHVQNIGWQDWVYDGNMAGTTGQGLRAEAVNIKIVKTSDVPMGVSYSSHVQNIGWQQNVIDNEISGTTGHELRIEALKINLTNAPSGARIKYQVYVQNTGWQDWVYDGNMAGTTGQGLRIEALRIVLENAPEYSIAYQTHVQNIGWQDWVYDGEMAGTTGQSLRVEAIKIKIIKK